MCKAGWIWVATTRIRDPRRGGAAPCIGGCTFLERPDRPAPAARLLWVAQLDPGVLRLRWSRAHRPGCDTFDIETLHPWMTRILGPDGQEHVALCDGQRRIRIDILAGALPGGPIVPTWELSGVDRAGTQLNALRQFLHLVRTGRFPSSRFPAEPRIARKVDVLRTADALAAGASQREIAAALFGSRAAQAGWRDMSDHLRSRVRRLAAEARAMGAGGYRRLLGRTGR